MNKKKVRLMFFLIIIGLYITSSNIFGFNNKILIPDNKAIYVAIIGGDLSGALGIKTPLTRICYLQLLKNNKDILVNKLEPVQIFKETLSYGVEIYYDHDLLFVNTQNDALSDFINVNIVSMDSPWNKKVFKKHYLGDLFPVKYGKDELLAYYLYLRKEKLLQMKLLDSKTLEEKKPLPVEFMKQQVEKAGVIKANKEQFTFIRLGIGEIPFPYISPPSNILQGIQKLELLFNLKKYIVVRSLYFASESEGKPTDIFILNKLTNDWTKYSLPGQENEIKAIEHYIVCRIGTMSPKGRQYPTVFTGEWILINLESRQQQTIKLKPVSRIVYASDDFLLTTNDKELLYIPIEDGKAIMEKSIVLYKDSDNVIGTADEIVNYIQGAFLGPKEVPEQK